ncbi:MFS transporter [Mangrovibacterium lignilyticum]|uniref:MFS transporter n=1 Tax=Mangrovibacterium lignilyticum TaxID=2668052 RepID=UPI0013D57579|nr:MFS transporter [Mangrovibacterium lignilyticum]
MFLLMPFGVMSGYVTVTIGYLLTQAGIPLEKVAPIVAITLLPNIFKFAWAPLVDTTLTVKKWYVIANIGTALGIFLTGILPLKVESLTLMAVIVFLLSLVNTIVAMSTESLLAHDTPDHLKGRAAGWLNAGNLGGLGLGGGAGLWLAQHLSEPWMAGGIIALACLLCTFGLLFLSEPTSFIKDKTYIKTIGNLNRDIWTLIKSRMGFLALFLCFLPLGTGAASNLWSSVSNDWNASADTVATVVGVGGGILSAIGCLIGGWICDKMDRKKAYILFGMVQALCTVGMAFSPQTELTFIIWTSLYALSSGLAYAGFSAFVLEAIGKGAAATKYNVFASLSNAPIYYMIYIDQWAHGKWGAFGMLSIESIMALLGAIFFVTIFVSLNKMRPVVVTNR